MWQFRFRVIAQRILEITMMPTRKRTEPAARNSKQDAAPSVYPHQARSVVVNRGGIVAASQTLASQAGAMILAQGGSAADAAIAANAVMSVTEPMSNGIGGDLFAIVYSAKTGKLSGLNASGWAPEGLSVEVLRARGVVGMPEGKHAIHLVTVPGAVAGWDALHRKFGKLPFSDLFQTAILLAQNGVPIAERSAARWALAAPQFADRSGFATTFLTRGKAPKAGDVFVDRDLAKSLRRIAEEGRDGFYKGPIARAILATSRAEGGTLSRADMEAFEPEWVDPISTTYHGWRVWELPPNGQGLAALQMLNIMEHFPLREYGQNSARAMHLMIEAKKLAYADLAEHVGDPRFSTIPTARLISKRLGKLRAVEIDAQRAQARVLPSSVARRLNAQGRDTTYLTVIDKDGNIVSLIQSIYGEFGVGLVPPGTGFVLHNRGALFGFEPGKVNTVAPRKRPFHTIIPGFMEKGPVKIGFGIMGGFNQAQAHAQFVSNVVDFGMNIQAALEAPRFTKATFDGCDVMMEQGIAERVRGELTERGHAIEVIEPFNYLMGRGNAVMSDGRGVHYGGSDPRADGAAIPEPIANPSHKIKGTAAKGRSRRS